MRWQAGNSQERVRFEKVRGNESGPNGLVKWELVNLDSDPGEVYDLIDKHPEKLAELLAHWEEYVVETGTVG
jgi:hypothetical protein